MTVYEPHVVDGYEWVNAVDDSDYDQILRLDGVPRGSTWKPIAVRRVRMTEDVPVMASDFPWLGKFALVMRRTAVDKLGDLLDANGEVLPLSTDDGIELYVYNAQVIDALDKDKSSPTSSIIMIPGTSRLVRVKKVAFAAAAVSGVDIFRLPQAASPTYLSEQFVQRVATANLQGLAFNRVWQR